jgi:formate hydrogenlyase subunit 6/NADH:ubiquinone oxidoreductase subunit I
MCRELGGEWRAQRRYAHSHWLAAAAAPGPSQPPAFARLGDYYRGVAGDAARARRCYQRALALDPLQASTGGCGALASCLACGLTECAAASDAISAQLPLQQRRTWHRCYAGLVSQSYCHPCVDICQISSISAGLRLNAC